MDDDTIQDTIAASRDKGWRKTRLKALSWLPRKRQDALAELLKKSENWRYRSLARATRLEQAANLLEGLKEDQRSRLFNDLFPSISEHLERAWKLAPERPNQRGHEQSPFRATSRPEIARLIRAQFFLEICESLQGYDPDPEWLAVHTCHFNPDTRDGVAVGWLLASILRAEDDDTDAVRTILIDSIQGRHDIGRISYEAILALLCSDKRADWEIIGKHLLAAQREEGLRQSILNCVCIAHPGAFRFMLGLILEHKLGRFTSVVASFDMWLGYQWAGGSATVVHDGVRKLCTYFDDDDARLTAIEGGEAEDAYLALWTTAFEDVDEALVHAAKMIKDADPARQYVALLIAHSSRMPSDTIEMIRGLLASGQELDERIQMVLCLIIAQADFEKHDRTVVDELFDEIVSIFHKIPSTRKKLETLVWPWDGFVRERRTVANALQSLAVGSPQKLLPYADAMDGHDCAMFIQELTGGGTYYDHESASMRRRKRRKLSEDERAFIARMTVDARGDVHEGAFEALKGSGVTPDEVELLTKNLHRTGASFRRGAISRLAEMSPAKMLSIGASLLYEKNAKKRAAGLELLASIPESDTHAQQAMDLVRERQDSFAGDAELEAGVKRLLGNTQSTITLDDCLGLVPEGSRAPAYTPERKNVTREMEAAKACLHSLAELFLEHAETEIEFVPYHADTEDNRNTVHIASHFPNPSRYRSKYKDIPTSQLLDHMPLKDIWSDWAANRGKKLRDPDGLELVRAWAMLHGWIERWDKLLPKPFTKERARDIKWAFKNLVDWLPLLDPREDGLGFLIDCVEDLAATLLDETARKNYQKKNYHKKLGFNGAYEAIGGFTQFVATLSEGEAHLARLGALKMAIMDLDLCEKRPSLNEFYAAYDKGLLNEKDFVWLLLKPLKMSFAHSWLRSGSFSFGPLENVITLTPNAELSKRPALVKEAQRVRERLLKIELTRGEQPTPATQPISMIRHTGGAEAFFRLGAALGKDKIVRQDQWGEPTRAYSFSRLISLSVPLESDTDENFQKLNASHKLSETKLQELGMYAPQWAGHIERLIGLTGFEDAVWWIHAHTKRSDTWRNQEIRAIWEVEIKERTELDSEDLEEGAVDVVWFQRMLATIGEDNWTAYQKPAKYASTSGGHKRAQLFASAMLDRLKASDLMKQIDDKREQNAVRALGLLPLPKKKADAEKETLDRYTRLQEFRRESRKFGSQRQASEGRAVDIGMQNLARTAGYRDPRRLQWAMEAKAVADLATGPVSVKTEETTVTLSIDEEGKPLFEVEKKGKRLKNVPAKLRKHAEISELKSRVTELRRQSSRMRESLEDSMCRSDVFTGSELRAFFEHPMLRPMIERMVFVASDESDSPLIGYPERSGAVLRSYSGEIEPVSKRDTLRIAHPDDLFKRGEWSDWQRECFESERVQPFKQVFRELYPRTSTESDQSDRVRRYAGHQVNPRQALALLKKRQWIFAPEEGCRRVYHDEGIVAELWFEEHFYTLSEIDGLTLEAIAFREKGSRGKRMNLGAISDRLFSETMRDLDLVVSVAHAGGVDPEASQSTIEMRAALLRETAHLLELSNITVEGHHAIIEGKRARYSLHLGSAIARVLPGRTLAIIAVHSHYRGRLFLPFADEDPRTAELMTKALMLARDTEIKDPSILQQIEA